MFSGEIFTAESVILCLDLEVSLRMVADGALLGRFLSYHDMTAVGALPDDVVIL